FSARCSFPERHPQFSGFLHASPGQLSEALRDHDLVVVIGAPVFTFHVEGHAAIFDGATTIFQITDDPDAAAVTPSGASIIATMKPALGRPGVRTVCLIGDGSAMYSIQALWTAARRKLPLTVVVINNAGYGAMRSFSQVMQVRNVPGLELPGIDFVKLAEGMGCHAVRVTKSAELAGALRNGLGHDGTSLIEVMVDSAVPLLYAQKN